MLLGDGLAQQFFNARRLTRSGSETLWSAVFYPPLLMLMLMLMLADERLMRPRKRKRTAPFRWGCRGCKVCRTPAAEAGVGAGSDERRGGVGQLAWDAGFFFTNAVWGNEDLGETRLRARGSLVDTKLLRNSSIIFFARGPARRDTKERLERSFSCTVVISNGCARLCRARGLARLSANGIV
jgi:hypothetical protein